MNREQYQKQYYLDNKESIIETKKQWYLDNKESIKESQKQYQRNRRQTDPLYKLKYTVRCRICTFIKRAKLKKTSKTVDMLGCTWEQCREHLEKQFEDGMTWDNHGDWHIDHIIPLASATTKEQIIKLCHYSNLQPLWAIDNMIKGDKIL